MKIKKKNVGGGVSVRGEVRLGGGVRMDVNEELKFFVKIQKKKSLGGGGWSGVGFRLGGQRFVF